MSTVTRPIPLAVLLTTALCCALLILPGVTVSSMYFNDLLIFLDGGYRVVHGQVPNIDFSTALGPLSFYIPGAGYWLSGSLGLAMPVGMSLLMLVTAPIAIHVIGSRMRPLIGVPVAIFVMLLLATPMNTGEAFSRVSFAMYYNRIGWALLALLLILFLRPERPTRHQTALDAAAAAALALLAGYTKATYGVVAAGFLLMLLQPGGRRFAILAILGGLVGVALAELVWGGTRIHIGDLIVATQTSGGRSVMSYVRSALETSGEYVVFLAFAAVALWVRPSVTDALFYGFCIAAGLMLLSQNFQTEGIVSLLVGAAVAAETLARSARPGMGPFAEAVTRGAPLAAILLLLPIGVSSAGALGLHAAAAATRSGVALETPNGRGLRVMNTTSAGQFAFYARYAESLDAGARLLRTLEVAPRRVLVFDFVSPFSSLLGIAPPDGGPAWMHNGRNFDAENHFPAEEVMGGVDVVMVPKRPVAGGTTKLMLEIYGAHLEDNFRRATDTELWTVYLRREARPTAPRMSRADIPAAR
ncbi:hypothetical protein ROJ8625_03320 [Roseivivax jejudonensis]|uniref:Glycosyltransferase RgtA/B/C/D-like domain-containing protein n=1 Tax=Roseivivax jejudonensis TaxID=1529041 RepID=A0A1X6ZYK9_9RHOB|nr:hypothetical protein [Roseivivax jejudonensis]SLN65148.1 hypothetical protein ROJ8625_03320 [Roseivivax jejudonensis]